MTPTPSVDVATAPAKSASVLGVLSLIVGLAWILFGIAGFIMSLICLGYSGNMGEKLAGILFAIVLGPFYWLYFYSVPSYCARLPPPSLF